MGLPTAKRIPSIHIFMKIAVAGTGYVGLSMATLLAQHHQVVAVDIIPEKVEMINRRQSPIQDEYIEKYFAEKELDLTASLDAESAYTDARFVIVAAPTNYDSQKNFFDTSAVEQVIDLVLKCNPDAIIIIKSTTNKVRPHITESSDSNIGSLSSMSSFIRLWLILSMPSRNERCKVGNVPFTFTSTYPLKASDTILACSLFTFMSSVPYLITFFLTPKI